jgi:hypothetical protein
VAVPLQRPIWDPYVCGLRVALPLVLNRCALEFGAGRLCVAVSGPRGGAGGSGAACSAFTVW